MQSMTLLQEFGQGGGRQNKGEFIHRNNKGNKKIHETPSQPLKAVCGSGPVIPATREA
jgi:hypothetical protein